jgi:hypothetical protein
MIEVTHVDLSNKNSEHIVLQVESDGIMSLTHYCGNKVSVAIHGFTKNSLLEFADEIQAIAMALSLSDL